VIRTSLTQARLLIRHQRCVSARRRGTPRLRRVCRRGYGGGVGGTRYRNMGAI